MNLKKFLSIAAAITAVIAVITLARWAFREKEAPADSGSEEQRDIEALRSIMSEQNARDIDNGDEGAEQAPVEKKFIRDIYYEKDEVCLGESLEMRLDLQNPDGPVSDLISRIGGKFGDRVILDFHEQGEETITILVKDPRGNMDMRRIKINVADCPGRAGIMVRASRGTNRADEAAISVIKKRGLECPCAYDWDFGDGTSLRTTDEKTSHDYGKREQEGISSTFIITVDVTDSRNVRARGRTSITMPNFHWASRQLGFFVVPIVQETAYGLTADRCEIAVKIKNIYENSIAFETAEIQARYCGGGEQPKSETIQASTIMKKTEVGGGETVEDSISIPNSYVPDSACAVTVTLKGIFPDKTPVAGMVFFLKE